MVKKTLILYFVGSELRLVDNIDVISMLVP
jgi:hypothetical protein